MSNKNIIRRLMNGIWNGRDLSVVDQLVAQDFVEHNPPLADLPTGREGFRLLARACLRSFPGCQVVLKTLIADGDTVALNFAIHASDRTGNSAPSSQVPTIQVEGISIYRLRNNQVVGRWIAEDLANWLRQRHDNKGSQSLSNSSEL